MWRYSRFDNPVAGELHGSVSGQASVAERTVPDSGPSAALVWSLCPGFLFGWWVGGVFEGQRIKTIMHFLLNSQHGEKTWLMFECFEALSLGVMLNMM